MYSYFDTNHSTHTGHSCGTCDLRFDLRLSTKSAPVVSQNQILAPGLVILRGIVSRSITWSAMSITLSNSGGSIVNAARPRLHVGLTLGGTLLSYGARPGHFHLRPHLAYFARVLKKAQCDVTVFSPFPESQQEAHLRKFRANFPHHHRVISRCDDLSDYSGILCAVCESAECDPRRILMIDSAISGKFWCHQTLILEKYVPQKRLRGDQRAIALAMAEHKQLASAAEDMALVAVADMILELSRAPSSTVPDYLKMEPLVEKVRVPGHGEASFLPNENCDHIEMVAVQ